MSSLERESLISIVAGHMRLKLVNDYRNRMEIACDAIFEVARKM